MKQMPTAWGIAAASLIAAPAAMAQTAPAEPVFYYCQASGDVPGGTITIDWHEGGSGTPVQYRAAVYSAGTAEMQLQIRWYTATLGPPGDHEFATFTMKIPKAKRGMALQLWRYPRHVAGEAAMQGADFPGGIGDPTLPIRLDELRAMASGRAELTLAAVDKYRVAFKKVPIPAAMLDMAAIPAALRSEVARRSADYRHLCAVQDNDIVVT